MAGYYFRSGNASRFLIYLEGGGWCYDQDCSSPTDAGTLGDCWQRSKGRLGSSRGWWPTNEWLTGCLSADPVQNPLFHDWTLVYVPYCDGTSFSGDTFRDGLHFRGRAILSAVVEDLKAHTEIQDATQVILSGGSAGASAVFYHIDSVADELALSRGELVGLPDSGFFLDLKDKDDIDCWPAQMRSMIQVSNGTAALHKGCLARYPEETWKCLFPEYFGDLVSSRMFVINSLYDSSEVTFTLRLGCCPGGCGGRHPACGGRDMKLFQAMRQQHLKAWAPLVNRTGNGVWAPACQAHVVAPDHWADASWEVPAGSGNTLAAVVQRWLDAAAGPAVRGAAVYEDAVAWPQNGPCASAFDSFEEVI